MRRFGAYLLAAFLLPAAAGAQSDDRGFLQGLLEDNLSGAGRDVRIEGFAGALSSTATIDALTIADDDGIWLTLTGVELDWSRASLLRGRLEVNRLSAESISLPRLPAAQPEDPELPAPEASGFSLPELPVAVNIGEISSPSITLGEPVMGVAAEFSLSGALSLEGGDGNAKIDVVRTDGAGGEFRLDAGYSNTDRVLRLALDLNEEPGGIVATLANLPGAPSVVLRVEGQGPLDDFAATLDLATDDAPRLAGSVRIGGAENPGADAPLPFRATLGGDVAPLFAPDYAAFFGRDIRLELTGARGADGSLAFDDFSLSADQIGLDGSLALDPLGRPTSFNLAGSIASATGEPVLLPVGGDPTRVGRVDLALGFDAAQSEDWVGRFTIAELNRPGFSADSIALDGSGRIPRLTSDDTTLTANFDFAAEALDLGDPAAEAALGERVTGRIEMARPEGEPFEFRRFDIAGESYAVAASGTLEIADRDLLFDASATASARDLSVLSGVAQRPLAGAAELTLSARGNLLAGQFEATAEGTTLDLSLGIPQADRIIAGAATLSISAARDQTGLTLNSLRLGTPAAQVTAQGVLKSAGSEINLSAALEDAGLLLEGLDGRHTLSLIASGIGETWSVRGSLVGSSLEAAVVGAIGLDPAPSFDGTLSARAATLAPFGPLAGLPDLSGAADIAFEGRVRSDLSRFDMTLSAETRDLRLGRPDLDPILAGTVSVSLDAARDLGPLTIRSLQAETATIGATGSGTIGSLPDALVPGLVEAISAGGAPDFDGTLTVVARDLSPAAAISGLPGLAGGARLAFNGRVTADLSSFDMTLSASGADLRLGRPDLDQLLSGEVSVSLDAARDRGPLAIRTLTASTATIRAEAHGNLEDLPEALLPGLAGALAAGNAPVFDGGLTLTAEDLAPIGPLARLRGLGGAVTATAQGRVAADLAEFDLVIDANGADLRTGIVAADEYLRGGTVLGVDVARSGGTFTIRRARFASPALTASAEGTMGVASGDLSAEVKIDNIARIVEGFSGTASAEVTAARAEGQPWQVQASADGPGGTNARVSGTVAADFATVDLGVTGSAPLGLANSFIQPRSVDGTAGFDLRIDGAPSLSAVSGTITVSDARAVAPNLRLVVNRLGGTITLARSTAQIDLSARIDGGGRLSLTGPIALAAPFNSGLRAEFIRVRFSDPELYETRVSGTITTDGALLGGGSVEGRLSLDSTELRIPSGVSGGTFEIPDITHLGEPRDVRVTRDRAGLIADDTAANGRAGGELGLDILVDAPNQIFIRGRGLDAELGGSLRMRGTTKAVVPQGSFSLIRGRLDILGKRLNLEEGSITLQGDFDPYLRLVATSQAEDVNVRVILEGLATEPQISFTSEPELPEDEVLARLLFGRGIQTLSPLQAAQLASAVATLAGKGGGGIMNSLRENFGLDDLDLATDETGGTAVRVGKYLSDNLYTNVEIGSEGTTEIQLNFDLTPSVTITGRATDAGETGVGVYYERDY